MADTQMETNPDNPNIEISNDINDILNDWEWLETAGSLTPFQRRSWLLPFYNILATQLGITPVFVLVRDTQTHRPLMLLPLCTRRWFGIKIIEFADLGVSDYNAPLIAKTFCLLPSQWQALWRRITAALKKKSSVLWLKKMPFLIGSQANPFVQYSKKSELMGTGSWGITLPSAFAAYNNDMLHPSFAKELAKKVRRVEKRGNIEYIITQSPEERHRAFNILAQQKQARCAEMGWNNMLAHPVYRQFYEAAVVETSDTLMKLATLKVNSEEVATLCALDHNKNLHVIMTTFKNGEWKSCSLGNVIMRTAIAHAIDSGVKFFDFTIGNESYKQQFAAKPNALYYALHPLTPIGFPVCVLLNCYIRIKKVLQGPASDNEQNQGRALNWVKRGILSIRWLFSHQLRRHEA